MLNVIDEFTRECLAIRVKRKLRSTDVIDVLSELFILRRAYSFRQWPRIRRHGCPRVDCRRWSQDRLHRARQSVGERLL